MRELEFTGAFKKDFKIVKRNPSHRDIELVLEPILQLLREDVPLPEANRDHHLTGNWKDFRDCHVKPDLVLIYRKEDNLLQLTRIGSHSKLKL